MRSTIYLWTVALAAVGLVIGVLRPKQPVDVHDQLVERLVAEEGYRRTVYRDSEGVETIGYGFRLSIGFTEAESRAVLGIRADSTLTQLARAWPPFASQPANVRLALADMAYELGTSGLLRFDTFLRLIEHDSLAAAVQDAELHSEWAREVPERARSVLELLGRD